MVKYNIYAGLGGGFGGATYQGTGEFENIQDAIEMAYEIAVEIYQSYEGYHGVLNWYDVGIENGLDPENEENEIEIDDLYHCEIEDWIEYYAVLTKEDDLEGEEIFEI